MAFLHPLQIITIATGKYICQNDERRCKLSWKRKSDIEIYPLFDSESSPLGSKLNFAVFERDNESLAKTNEHIFVFILLFRIISVEF